MKLQVDGHMDIRRYLYRAIHYVWWCSCVIYTLSNMYCENNKAICIVKTIKQYVLWKHQNLTVQVVAEVVGNFIIKKLKRQGICLWQEDFLIDWCCFYYFVRNSLVALMEALCARKGYFATNWTGKAGLGSRGDPQPALQGVQKSLSRLSLH